ncbi:10406_t:CDS:2, partial [Dentiscutata heterogama]
MASLKEWFNAAVSGEEFNEIRYNDLKEFVFIDRGAFGEKQDVFDAFIKELKLHIKLGDNNRIINFLGISKDPNDESYLIVMEYADSGSLQQFLIKERDNLQWAEKLSLGRHTIRLEPLYNPQSQLPENSRSLNALLSSIRCNPTLIFDENLAVPLKSNNETPPDYGTCKYGHKFTDVEWCNECESENFRESFDKWTSGNQQLDELIKESQLKAINVSNYIRWIKYHQFEDFKIIKEEFFAVISAIWRVGPCEEWCLKAYDSDISTLMKEVKLHLYCDKAIRCYGVTFNPTHNYGLVLKNASYGDLRSFINQRALIGWWQKLKILEGIILGLNQIHLKAGYIHRDLHSGNILIDQDELSVSVLSAYISDFELSIPIVPAHHEGLAALNGANIYSDVVDKSNYKVFHLSRELRFQVARHQR